jgi:hypothetical protein
MAPDVPAVKATALPRHALQHTTKQASNWIWLIHMHSHCVHIESTRAALNSLYLHAALLGAPHTVQTLQEVQQAAAACAAATMVRAAHKICLRLHSDCTAAAAAPSHL